MTDENKTPERMWRETIGPSSAYPKGGSFYYETEPKIASIPYIREDVALAMVAAAYEAAAKEADDYMEPHVANGILSLTPDDARAALDKMLAAARQQTPPQNEKEPAAGEGDGASDDRS